MMTLEKIIVDETAMLVFGATLAAAASPPLIIYLHGTLGAGKTTLVRGFLRHLGVTEAIKSPTYPLVESYDTATGMVYHFDLYRIHHPSELNFIGIRDYFIQSGIFLIEWPEQGAGIIPPPDVICEVIVRDPGRKIQLLTPTKTGKKVCEKISSL